MRRRSGAQGMRHGLVAAAAAVLLMVVAACGSQGGSGGNGSDQNPADTLVIGARVDNTTFDTADLEMGNRVQYWQPVYDTLLRLDADAQPHPNLATKWSYNKDATVLTLQLRKGVKFTDGTAFNGDAVKANIEHLKSGSGQNQFMVADIKKVVVKSPTTVELHLDNPVPALLNYLATVGGAMASPKAIKSGDLAKNPVGSGPYVYDAKDSKQGTEYRFTRNDDYWNAKAYPYDAYVVRPINDLTPTLNALKSGEIDGALLEPSVAAEAKSSGLTLEKRAINWIGLLLADRAGKMVPELQNVKVRQAINYALNRPAIVKGILSGYGQTTNQTFNTASQAFDKSLDSTYTYDVSKAKALMKQAGVSGFELTMPSWDGPWNDLFPVLSDELAKIGIKVKWHKVPPDQAISAVLSGDYPAAFFPLGSASAWQDIQTWVAPKAPWNMFKADDPALDKLIAKAQNSVGAAQDKAFQAVNQWLVKNAWFAPIARAESVFGVTSSTTVSMQAQNVVPSLRQFAPAG